MFAPTPAPSSTTVGAGWVLDELPGSSNSFGVRERVVVAVDERLACISQCTMAVIDGP